MIEGLLKSDGPTAYLWGLVLIFSLIYKGPPTAGGDSPKQPVLSCMRRLAELRLRARDKQHTLWFLLEFLP